LLALCANRAASTIGPVAADRTLGGSATNAPTVRAEHLLRGNCSRLLPGGSKTTKNAVSSAKPQVVSSKQAASPCSKKMKNKRVIMIDIFAQVCKSAQICNKTPDETNRLSHRSRPLTGH